MTRIDIHIHERADDVSPLAAMALTGVFLMVVGPALALAAMAIALTAAVATYAVVCDLAGWAVVAVAYRELPRVAWPLTGGLIKIMRRN